jgi:hypothetical protein
MKYGGRNLKELFDRAMYVAKGEAAPEEIEERGGDFYVVPVTVAGKERELYIAPIHMAKLSAFVKMVETNLQK